MSGREIESHFDYGNLSGVDSSQTNFLQFMIKYYDEAMAMLELTEDGIRYCFNNDAHQRLSGYASSEIKGKCLEDILGEAYYKKYEQEILESFDNGIKTTFQGIASWKGVKKEFFCRLFPFQSEGKKYMIVTEIETDFLKTWMKTNKLAVTKFDQMFQENASIMLLIEPETGNIIDANLAAVQFYGYSLAELTQMKIQSINTLTDDEVRIYRKRAADSNKQYFLFRHRLKNGEIRLVDVYSSPIEIDHKRYLFSVILDATKREENEEELFREKVLQRITMDSIADAVVTTDIYGNITYMNQAAEHAVEWSSQEARGKLFHEVFHMSNEYTLKEVSSIVQKVLDTEEKQELENHTILHTKGNRLLPIEDSAAPIIDKNGDMYGVVVIFRDVTNAKEKKKKIEYLSYHDALTGLYNRRFYYDNYDKTDCERMYPLGYIMGDVNGLKMTNDVFGHTAGDQLLNTVAKVLWETVTPEHVVIRWGGDEFIIVIPDATERQMEDIITDIKQNLAKESIREKLEVSVSFGMAIKKSKWESTDGILKEAEEKMYQNKLLESKSLRGNTIQALMTTLDEKSQETKDHTMRLSKMCMQIAEKLNLQSEVKNRLELLAMLHDIGKVGIPDYILGKPGSLDLDEWSVMKTHPEIGYRIASNVNELNFVANEILYHHEKWDGTGYPSGLAGEEIPINCRILSLVDAYDAMTNDRVYRKAKTHEEAVAEINKFKGIQFDPTIVSLFLETVS